MPDWLDFDRFTEWVSGEWWSYLVIFAVAVVDAFFPLVPS
jgi:membrane protein DedA with SNARE-associated domain